MNDCIFCKVVDGTIPSNKIYEDETLVVLLDIGPVHKGHSLIITKEHLETLMDTPDIILEKIGPILKKTAAAVKKATGCDGVNIIQNNFSAAGQLVFHLHFHVIPRFEGDGLKTWPQGTYDDGDMEKYAELIKENWD